MDGDGPHVLRATVQRARCPRAACARPDVLYVLRATCARRGTSARQHVEHVRTSARSTCAHRTLHSGHGTFVNLDRARGIERPWVERAGPLPGGEAGEL